jgi:hypothetical protein
LPRRRGEATPSRLSRYTRPDNPVPRRPEGWSKEYVLQWLRDNPELRPHHLFAEAGERTGVRVRMLSEDVTRWKRKDYGFAATIRGLLAGRPPIWQKPRREVDRPNWREEWAEEYLQSGDREAASEAVGSSWAYLYRLTLPNGGRYDDAFAKVVEDCIAIRTVTWENRLEWAGLKAMEQGDARTLGNLALSVLERLNKKQWTRSEDRSINAKVEHEHTHRLILTEGQAQAVRHAELLAAKLPFALLPTPAPDVVDVVVVDEREKVRA